MYRNNQVNLSRDMQRDVHGCKKIILTRMCAVKELDYMFKVPSHLLLELLSIRMLLLIETMTSAAW